MVWQALGALLLLEWWLQIGLHTALSAQDRHRSSEEHSSVCRLIMWNPSFEQEPPMANLSRRPSASTGKEGGPKTEVAMLRKIQMVFAYTLN